jgi:hypothetical protein
MPGRDGFNRALCHAAAAQAAAVRIHDPGMLAESRHIQRDDPDRTGRHAPAAAAAAAGIDGQNSRQAGYNPRSICFHVNSGFACVREKG